MKAVIATVVALLASGVASTRFLGASHHKGRGGGRGGASAGELQAEAVANSLGEVIEVLSTMMKEFADQEVQDKENWEKYSTWSDDAEQEKNQFIQDQNALIMSKQAQENANKQMIQQLTNDLAKLASDIADTQASLAELIKMRQEERAQFEAGMADVTKTIAAVTKATEILEGHYAANGADLAEIRSRVQLAIASYGSSSKLTTPENVKALAALLQGTSGMHEPDYLSVDGSKYNTYEKQGGAGGVIGMLEDLRSQLESQRQDMIAKENDAQRQYEETKAAKETDLAHMQKTQSEKAAKKVECQATVEECLATIDQATKDIADAEDYLKLLLLDRAKFTKQFGQRTALRKQEQAATQAALDALQAVSAGAKDAVEGGASLIQRSHKRSLKSTRKVQMSAQAGARIGHEMSKLIALGKELKSSALVQMASKLKQDYFGSQQQTFYDAGAFGPVLKLLNDLITRLEEEQNAETSQHEWCETEKANGVASKTEREKNIHTLKANIEALTTSIAQLKTEVLFLESEIARVQEETRIAKQIREQEHAVYVQAKKDHEEVIAAIGKAMEALSGQYSLVQVRAGHSHRRQAPGGATPFASYASGSGGAASAQEMLEDLNGRYGQALEEIIADEKASAAAHEALLKRNAQFVADCTQSRNAKVSERRGQINQLGNDKGEMKTNLIELHEVSKYLQDLRPSCDDIRSTFEERKKRREAEIAALKEALEVISDPSMMA